MHVYVYMHICTYVCVYIYIYIQYTCYTYGCLVSTRSWYTCLRRQNCLGAVRRHVHGMHCGKGTVRQYVYKSILYYTILYDTIVYYSIL